MKETLFTNKERRHECILCHNDGSEGNCRTIHSAAKSDNICRENTGLFVVANILLIRHHVCFDHSYRYYDLGNYPHGDFHCTCSIVPCNYIKI